MMLANQPRAYPRLNRGLFLGEVRLVGSRMAGPDELVRDGAILKVTVNVPAAYQQSGGAAPQQLTLTAMVDTGASISCINVSAGQQLGLPQVGSTQLGTAGGTVNAPIYAAAISLPEFGVTVDPVQIAGTVNPLPGVDMLIGRDVLRGLQLNYHGGQGAFTISQEEVQATTQNSVNAAPPTPGTVVQPGFQPQGGLPQPPGGGSSGTILGMKPLVAVGVGVGVAAAITGALFLFDVL